VVPESRSGDGPKRKARQVRTTGGASNRGSDRVAEEAGSRRGTGAGPGRDAPHDASPSPSRPGVCPYCGAPCEPSDKFCEECGHELAPKSSVSSASRRQRPPPEPADITGAVAPVDTEVEWEAVVEANRAFYVFNHAIYDFDGEEYEFPASVPPRVVALIGPTVTIGRSRVSPATHPDIDLRAGLEDRLVSHEHAVVELRADGTCVLTDPHSTNGTFVNDATKDLKRGTPIEVHDGDRIYVGAWTRILLRVR